jgi:hypothetical protein
MLLANGFVSFWTITCISALGSSAIGGEIVTTLRRVAFAWFCPSSVVQFSGIIKDMPSVEFVYVLLPAGIGLAVWCTINEVLLVVFLIWAEGFPAGSNTKFMRPVVLADLDVTVQHTARFMWPCVQYLQTLNSGLLYTLLATANDCKLDQTGIWSYRKVVLIVVPVCFDHMPFSPDKILYNDYKVRCASCSVCPTKLKFAIDIYQFAHSELTYPPPVQELTYPDKKICRVSPFLLLLQDATALSKRVSGGCLA